MNNKTEISMASILEEISSLEQMLPDGVHGWEGFFHPGERFGVNDEDPNLFMLPNIPRGNWKPWWFWRNKGGFKNGVEITF